MPFGLLAAIFSLLVNSHWDPQRGIASYYYPNDGHCGPLRADGRPFRSTDKHIAHRSLPLGLPVLVENLTNGVLVATTVRDRGPFGFCVHRTRRAPRCPPKPPPLARALPCPETHRWVIRTRLRRRECGYYRGIIDLTLPVARSLQASHFTPVRLWIPKRATWHTLLRRPDS